MDNEEQQGVEKDGAAITGRTDGPYSGNDTDIDRREKDNIHRPEQENSANGLDSVQVRGGQDGRNNRGIGSTDMDSENGLLRTGDTSNSTMEVTEEGMNSAVADTAKTDTGTVAVTTHGPDDYASADQVPVPNAQKEAKKQDDNDTDDDDKDDTDKQQIEREEDVAETGTDLTNQPAY